MQTFTSKLISKLNAKHGLFFNKHSTDSNDLFKSSRYFNHSSDTDWQE